MLNTCSQPLGAIREIGCWHPHLLCISTIHLYVFREIKTNKLKLKMEIPGFIYSHFSLKVKKYAYYVIGVATIILISFSRHKINTSTFCNFLFTCLYVKDTAMMNYTVGIFCSKFKLKKTTNTSMPSFIYFHSYARKIKLTACNITPII